MAIERLRERLPLLVFVLLVVVCLLLLGFACACITDHPSKAIERALMVIPALPPLIEVWSANAFALVLLALVVGRRIQAEVRSSPAVLQRFLL